MGKHADDYERCNQIAHPCHLRAGHPGHCAFGYLSADKARLVAAAPDLLAACKALVAHPESGEERADAMALARAAIAKAGPAPGPAVSLAEMLTRTPEGGAK